MHPAALPATAHPRPRARLLGIRTLVVLLVGLIAAPNVVSGIAPAPVPADIALVAGEYDAADQGLQPATANDRAPQDLDGDGITQQQEFALARQFMPTVWFSGGDNCTEPAGNRTHKPVDRPGQLTFKVNRHPENPRAISMQYQLLFARDCGSVVGDAFSHNGDVEPFSITLTPNASCQNGFGIYSVRTWAHEGTSAEDINTDVHTGQCRWGFSRYSVNHDRPDGRLGSAKDKHGLYLDFTECNLKFISNNACNKDFTPADVNRWNGLNVGERDAPLARDLAAVDFAGESVWTGTAFCGGVGRAGNCPKAIESKFRLHAPAQQRVVALQTDAANRVSAYVLRARADGSQVTETLDAGIDLGPEGDRVFLVVYGTGIGSPTLGEVSASINGVNVPAAYAGPSGYPGVEQVNLEIPRFLGYLRGDTEIALRVGSIYSKAALVAFAQPRT